MSPTFAALAVRNYRLYIVGQVLSNTGTWMQRVAQDWLVLGLTGGSGVALGITTGLQFLPFLLFSLWGGTLADRLRRRRLLVATQAAMGVLAVALGVLTLTGTITVGLVYAFAFLLGVAAAVDNPARQAFVGEMVPRETLPNAVALNSASFNLGRIVGPALAGLLIAGIGTGAVFIVNGLSYAVAIAALVLMRPGELVAPVARRAAEQVRLVDGLRYVRSRWQLVLVLVIVFAVGTFGFNFALTLALMAQGEFGVGAAAFGLLSTALAVGALSGSLIAARRIAVPLRLVVLSAIGFGLVTIAVGTMPTFVTMLVSLPVVGAAALTFSNAAQSYLQLESSERMRGRVMGVYTLVFFGGTPLGAPTIGWLADQAGPRWGLWAGGAAVVLITVLATLLLKPRRRSTSAPLPDQSGQADGPASTRRTTSVPASSGAAATVTGTPQSC